MAGHLARVFRRALARRLCHRTLGVDIGQNREGWYDCGFAARQRFRPPRNLPFQRAVIRFALKGYKLTAMVSTSTMIARARSGRLTATSSRYYPGWTMMGISAAAQYMSAPGQSYSVAAFKDPMRLDLGISETQYSLAYSFATVVSACFLPFVGRLVDRFGARVLLPLIATGLGSACLYMSRVESLTELYLGFGFVRSLGQGALSLVSVWLIGEWFERRRGIATALAGMGGGFSVMTIPLLNNWLITRFGWGTAWVSLAIAVWVVLVLPSIILVRNRPEDLGLLPDGIEPDEQLPDTHRAFTPTKHSWTVQEVLRDATFWKLLSFPATAGLVGTGLIFHQVALLGSHGLTATMALGMMSVQALFATLMILPAGWATDRVESRYLLIAGLSALSAAVALAIIMPSIWLAIPYAMLLGLNGSIARSTANVVWINYYGRSFQGSVRGVAWSVMILASAVGPLPLALSIDYYDSYNPALYVFFVMPLAASVCLWSARPPRKKIV